MLILEMKVVIKNYIYVIISVVVLLIIEMGLIDGNNISVEVKMDFNFGKFLILFGLIFVVDCIIRKFVVNCKGYVSV